MALMPFSGSMPACAALPVTVTSMAKYDGPPVMIVSSVSLSSRKPRVAVIRLKVELLHAEQAHLLLARDGDLDGRPHGRDAQRLEHLRDAGLVVGAEDRVAAGADHAVRQPRLDALAGLHRVAVAREQDRRRGAALRRQLSR